MQKREKGDPQDHFETMVSLVLVVAITILCTAPWVYPLALITIIYVAFSKYGAALFLCGLGYWWMSRRAGDEAPPPEAAPAESSVTTQPTETVK